MTVFFFHRMQQVHDIEFAQIESQVLEGLKQGNNSLKKMQEVMSLEEVEKIMDETADAVEYQRQISDLLGGSLSDEDEADVSCLIIRFSQYTVHEKNLHGYFYFTFSW